MNMNIIQQFDVEIIEDKLIIIDWDYYKPCNTLIQDPTNYIFKFDSANIEGLDYINLYFDLDAKFLGTIISTNYWKLEYEVKK